MPQILKKRYNFTLRWLLGLGNTSEQNLKLKTLGYLIFITAIFLSPVWPSHGQSLAIIEETVPLLMLVTAFGLSIFGPKVARRGWVSTCNWVPSGLWSQCHNPFNQSSQIIENTLLTLAPSFSEMWKCPQYSQDSNGLKLLWSLGLHNTSLVAKFKVQNFHFCWSIKPMS